MSVDETPFADVRPTDDGFTLPRLKWREMVFTGAVKADGDVYVRDPARPLGPFRAADLFPAGARFRVTPAGDRVRLTRVG